MESGRVARVKRKAIIVDETCAKGGKKVRPLENPP